MRHWPSSIAPANRRDLIRERTRAGLSAARARGRQGGKPKGLTKEAQAKAAAGKTLYAGKDKTVAEIGQILNLSRATVYRYLQWEPERIIQGYWSTNSNYQPLI